MNDKKPVFVFGILLLLLLAACEQVPLKPGDIVDDFNDVVLEKHSALEKFSSCSALADAFETAQEESYDSNRMDFFAGGIAKTAALGAPEAMSSVSRDFSTTNIQVEGVDEADIIKTDGEYIYAVANNRLYVAEAYPAEKASLLSVTELKDFSPTELFIHGDRLLLFGSTNRYARGGPKPGRPLDEYAPGAEPGSAGPGAAVETVVDSSGVGVAEARIAPEIWPGPWSMNVVSARLYDVSDKKDPDVIRTVELEGSYVTSRKIGSDVYFVVNSYPHYWDVPVPMYDDIVPMYSENGEDFEPVAKCVDISYIPPLRATDFITVASMSMTDEDRAVDKEVIAGSGANVYASQENLYVTQSYWGRKEKTIVSKFALKGGKINFIESGDVPGRILNQFSMDEFGNHFRIATTIGEVWDSRMKSSNNVYVLDDDLDVVGKLEDLAPGESIYSVRFMGKKAYVVTFKKIDPLFVIDLSDPKDPKVLGKLKIPGYSDYLHPYDETHIIGIGKEAEEAESEKGMPSDFAWYQGIKMAIFDVSDVEHPVEMHKVVIGDRGTDSPALHDHKAFLFDKEKNLLVIPVLLAEIQGDKSRPDAYGDYVFQGAYVYDVSLSKGFKLKGKVSHYDSKEAFLKSGYYFEGDASILRSLYIDDVLYTFSSKRIQLNSLDDLERLKVLEFPPVEKEEWPPYYEDEIEVVAR